MTNLLPFIRSLTPGRARIRHERLRGLAPETLALLTDSILAIEGITAAEINPRVGSMLIRWNPELVSDKDLLESAEFLVAMLESEAAQNLSDDSASAPCDNELPANISLAAADAAASLKRAGHTVLDMLAPMVAPNLARQKLARTRRVTQNRLMLAGLVGSLATLAVKSGKGAHTGLGVVFLALLAVHLYQHKKVL